MVSDAARPDTILIVARPWFAVLNPVSGGGRAARDRLRIVHALREAGVEFDLATSNYAGHTVDLAAKAAIDGYRKFLAIGGDGTLNQMLNGAMSADAASRENITLGLLPVGRGNDWARTHAIPRNYRQAARVLARERVAPHDIGIAEAFAPEGARVRAFLNVAGAGFDAHIVARTPDDRWGALAYLAALPAGFLSYEAKPLTLSIDGHKVTGKFFVTFAALGRFCGAGMHVAPNAMTDDGLFDVVIIEAVSALELLLNIRRLFDGSIESYRKVKVLRGRSIDIAGPEPVPAEADGELLPPTPLRLQVLPHAIRVVVP